MTSHYPFQRGLPSFEMRLPVRMAAGFLLLYIALGWVSYIHPMRGANITPWTPQAAIAAAVLLWRPGSWWLVLTAACIQGLLRPGPLIWPGPLLACVLQTLGYAMTAAALHAFVRIGSPLPDRRDVSIFICVAAGGALATALLQAASLAAFAEQPTERLLAAVHRGWISEFVALLVTLPVVLVLAGSDRRSASQRLWRSLQWWLIVGVTAAATATVFGQPADEQFKFFYLLFLPVIWAAARFGVLGSIWAAMAVQAMLIIAVQPADYRPLTIFELQLLLAVLAATGLLLGVIVDEREEAARNLRSSQRLAAAGDMAAALAHELNQPLMAITNYARASQLMAERLGAQHEIAAKPLVDVTGKLMVEAARAGEVVRHLRNFFRERSTELQLTDMKLVVEDVLAAHEAHANAKQILLESRYEPAVPRIWADPVQIGVVLRNMVANALEAAGETELGQVSRVSVRVGTTGDDVLVEVYDSGPGIPAQEMDAVFESRRSAKPGGMGLGLGISKSIVEAHGGRAWAQPGPGGKFFFSLPIGSGPANE